MASYLIKCIVCSGILLAVYHFLLEREKMLRFNRFYLLAAMVFSLLIPFATIEMPSQMTREDVTVAAVPRDVPRNEVEAEMVAAAPASRNILPDYWPALAYGLLSTLLLARLVFQISKVVRGRKGRRIIPFETAQLVLVPDNIASYTFMNSIFVSEEAFDQRQIQSEILAHELAHARQMHTLDIVFTEMLLALCWFNPLFLLYRRSIRLNHEYLADEAVLKVSADVTKYQLLLLNTLIAQRSTVLASSFHYSVTQKRLAMMTTITHLPRQIAKQAATFLLIILLAFVLSEKTYSQKDNGQAPASPARSPENRPAASNGVTKAEMDEFFAVVERHTRYVTDIKGRRGPVTEMDNETLKKEFAIFSRMNETQQLAVRKAGISLYESDIPVRKSPEPEMFENWKKPHIFGIWLNEKHVPNTELDKYKNTDIAEYSLHKLVGRGLRGKGYKYQLELTTNKEFDRTFEQRVRDRIVLVRITWFEPPRVKADAKK